MLTLSWLLILTSATFLGGGGELGDFHCMLCLFFLGSYCKIPFYSKWRMWSASRHSTLFIVRTRANFAPPFQLLVSEILRTSFPRPKILHRKQPNGLYSYSALLQSFWQQDFDQSVSKFSTFRRFRPSSMLLDVQVGCHKQLRPCPRKKIYSIQKHVLIHAQFCMYILVSTLQRCLLISSKFKSPKYLSHLFMTIYPKTIPVKATQLCIHCICQGKVPSSRIRNTHICPTFFMTIYPKTFPVKAKQLCSRHICQCKVSTL
jgi:hypothetical protein